ncbi:MAG: threonine aldolase family protein [Candidatus Aminicenantia bacterium]
MIFSDFRSDTVTKPTERMRKAMYEAEVGDDVLGDDPTVKKLEEFAAEKIGKEASLFVPSGSMGNSICVKLWTKEGDEVILEERSHIYNIELGSLSVISRVLPRPLSSKRGEMAPEEVEKAIRKRTLISNGTSLICLENTHNFWSGAVLSVENFKEIRKIADKHNLKIHLDGARIFNASIAKKIPVKEWTSLVDSVMFCLSKGLSAPIGSIVAGSKEFIDEARRLRKLLGGGMRQVGVIAAAGIVALEEMIERLEEDHTLAKKLAYALSEIKGIEIDPEGVETNIIIFKIKKEGLSAGEFVEKLIEKGILALSISENEVRFCTHKDVKERDVDRALKVIKEIMH